MDKESLSMIRQSMHDFAKDNQTLFQHIEQPDLQLAALDQLYQKLAELGVLNFLYASESHHDIPTLAAIAYELARYSASAASLVVQQNLGVWLMAEAQQELPEGWLCLPLFDAVMEWPHQGLVALGAPDLCLTGRWLSLPLLPIAEHILLPLYSGCADEFKLLHINGKEPGLTISPVVPMLGLRGLPQADLSAHTTTLKNPRILLQGAAAFEKVQALWSQAEVCMQAIRAAISHSSYHSALSYTKERYQGGKLIIEHSLIQKMLADFHRENELLNYSWQDISQTLSPYQPLSQGQQALMMQSAERLPWLTSDGIQLLGGVGYMEDYPQERRYRDTKQCEFLLGHPQVKNFSLWRQ